MTLNIFSFISTKTSIKFRRGKKVATNKRVNNKQGYIIHILFKLDIKVALRLIEDSYANQEKIIHKEDNSQSVKYMLSSAIYERKDKKRHCSQTFKKYI